MLFRSRPETWRAFRLQVALQRLPGRTAGVGVESSGPRREPGTPQTAAHQASLSFTISWSLLKLMSMESVMLSNHLFLCHPLLFWPSVFPSIRVFSNGSALHISWPEYWGFSFTISPSSAYSGLICFRIDLFVLLAVQRTLESLLQLGASELPLVNLNWEPKA